MQTQKSSTDTYVLGQAPEAIQRLLKQGQLLNPFTSRVLEEAGITTGMNVLDLGCGPGDISLLAASLVGKTGRVLGSHYRKPISYTGESFTLALRNLQRLKKAFAPEEAWPDPNSIVGNAAATTTLEQAIYSARIGFEAAMDDDFNAPVALACLFELSTEIFKGRSANASESALDLSRETLEELGGVLGLRMNALSPQRRSQESEPFIALLIEIRRELKATRQFALADRIRERLKELGITLEDRTDGTSWKHEGGVS